MRYEKIILGRFRYEKASQVVRAWRLDLCFFVDIFIATIQKIQSIGRSRCKVKTQDLLSPASELTRPSKMPMSITHLQSYIALRSISALVFFITINHNISSILFMILTSNGHDWDIVAKLVSKNPHYNPRRRENLYKNY